MNGKRIDYHASINFSDDIYHIITNNQRETLYLEIKDYLYKQGNNYGGGNKIFIKHIQIEIYDIKFQVSSSVPGDVSNGIRSHMIQGTTYGTIMRGRNEQYQHHRNRN